MNTEQLSISTEVLYVTGFFDILPWTGAPLTSPHLFLRNYWQLMIAGERVAFPSVFATSEWTNLNQITRYAHSASNLNILSGSKKIMKGTKGLIGHKKLFRERRTGIRLYNGH